MTSSSANEHILKIEKPLLYLSRDNFKNISKVMGLAKTLAAPLDAIIADSEPNMRRAADSMKRILDGYDDAPLDQKRSRAEKLIALLDNLKNPPALSISETADRFNALDTPIQFVKGVGPVMAEKLARIGVHTVEDALYLAPRDYEDRRNISKIKELVNGKRATVAGTIALAGASGRRGERFEAIIRDDTGLMALKWYNAGTWISDKIKKDDRVVVYGMAKRYRYQWEMSHPEVTPLEEDEDPTAGGVLPVYPSTESVTKNYLRKIIGRAVEEFADLVPDPVPREVATKMGLMPLGDAFRAIHKPSPESEIDPLRMKTSRAHGRLVFNELFALETGLALRRRGTIREDAWAIASPGAMAKRVLARFSFGLTDAQKRCAHEIREDMRSPHPMNRLLQGDVGSGKTLVALLGATLALEAGLQAAIMAPTEILAEQHTRNFRKLLDGEDVAVRLLTGKMKAADRRAALADAASARPCLVIGTHAVIQDDVAFSKLAYVVVDEQHRFGVRQRQDLKAKGDSKAPHTLVMTATPIPRTLALTVFGDLALSVIDQMPPGRTPIKTVPYSERSKGKVWEETRKELAKGRRAYVVYPLVEESDEDAGLLDATRQAEILAKDVFPEYPVGLIHGRMKPAEKEKVMKGFADGRYRVLVATTVIEVGIDVPEATVMIVEHAERFGLSQLHQLRGRVGRGGSQSYCYLIYRFARSQESRQRLEIMAATTDGFKIAEADLEMRGPGEFLGSRQHGMPDFRIANIARDGKILIDAKTEAFALVEADPELKSPGNAPLKHYLRRMWKDKLSLAGVA